MEHNLFNRRDVEAHSRGASRHFREGRVWRRMHKSRIYIYKKRTGVVYTYRRRLKSVVYIREGSATCSSEKRTGCLDDSSRHIRRARNLIECRDADARSRDARRHFGGGRGRRRVEEEEAEEGGGGARADDEVVER